MWQKFKSPGDLIELHQVYTKFLILTMRSPAKKSKNKYTAVTVGLCYTILKGCATFLSEIGD